MQTDDIGKALLRLDMSRFLSVLRVELQHLETHAELLVKACAERKRKREVSERVCGENIAVLENEERGFEHFIRIIDTFDIAQHESVDSLVSSLKTRFLEALETRGLATASYVFAERKIEKVLHYVQTST